MDDDYDPIRDYAEAMEMQRICNEYEIAEIDEVISRLEAFGFSDCDYHVFFSALVRAKMSYELEDSYQHQAAKDEAATIIMRNPELSEQKKNTKLREIYELKRVNKPNLNNLVRDYNILVSVAGLHVGLNHAVGLATRASQADRIAKASVNLRTKPKFLKSKEDVILHLAKIYSYQSYEACRKSLEREGVQELPNTWEKA